MKKVTATQRPLTLKRAKFVEGKLLGKTNAQAYRDAGYKASNDNVARVESSKLLNKPNVQEAFMDAMHRAGIDADVLAQTIRNGLNASKTVIVRDPGAVDTDESKNSAFVQEVPDHAVRHKYLETSLKVAGLVSSDASGITNNFIYVSSSQEQKYGI